MAEDWAGQPARWERNADDLFTPSPSAPALRRPASTEPRCGYPSFGDVKLRGSARPCCGLEVSKVGFQLPAAAGRAGPDAGVAQGG
eukprot:scaffold22881_cov104-Isochrysis_galbana.AAC.1